MTDYTLDAATRRCNAPQRVLSTAGYASGFIDPADKAAAIADLQARYDLPYRMWHRSPAPPISANESLSAYQRRLPQGLVAFSDKLSSLNFARVDDGSLAPLSKMLVENVVKRFTQPQGKRPVAGAPFENRERWYTTQDQAGREVRHFCAAAEDSCWLPFTHEVLLDGTYVGPKRGGINFKLGTGANSYEARAHAAQVEREHEHAILQKHAAASQQRAGAAG